MKPYEMCLTIEAQKRLETACGPNMDPQEVFAWVQVDYFKRQMDTFSVEDWEKQIARLEKDQR